MDVDCISLTQEADFMLFVHNICVILTRKLLPLCSWSRLCSTALYVLHMHHRLCNSD